MSGGTKPSEKIGGGSWSHNIWPISAARIQPEGRMVSRRENRALARPRRLSTKRKVVQTPATAHDRHAACRSATFSKPTQNGGRVYPSVMTETIPLVVRYRRKSTSLTEGLSALYTVIWGRFDQNVLVLSVFLKLPLDITEPPFR